MVWLSRNTGQGSRQGVGGDKGCICLVLGHRKDELVYLLDPESLLAETLSGLRFP